MSQLKICPQCGAEYELDQRFCPKDGSTLRMQGAGNDLVGTIIADRYHVLKKLGEGGMGQVYLAEHVKMGRRSAVKVMNPGMVNDADAISRFNREAANASRINHPNVAAVYDFGETSEGLIYLAMEFIEGPPLTKLIEDQGALPPLRAGDITRQAADALTIAHDMGIVHRDLKPDNIMIARTRDGGDLVKVVDFGIAKAADNAAQKVTKTGLVVGTPEYMSPEQLAGDKLDGRSDIYSLALVAFNMLTGKLPFPAETVQESMIMRLTDLPKRLAEMRPETSWTPDVQAVLDRALERESAKRYQTAAEFGRELYRAIEKMPVSALAEIGTQVIAAGGAMRAAGGGGATAVVSPAAVPATRVASSAEASGVPAPRKKSRTMLVAAAVAVAVLGVGGTAAFMSRGGSKGADTAAPPQGTAAPGPEAPAATPSGTSVQQPSKPLPNVGGGETRTAPKETKSGAAPAPTGSARADVGAVLDKIEPMVGTESTPATAKQAIEELKGLSPKLLTADDRLHWQILKAQAYFALDNPADACDLLRQLQSAAIGSQRSTRVNGLLKAC